MSDPQQLREKIAKTIGDVAVPSGDPEIPEMPVGFALGDSLVLRIADALLPLVLGEKREAWDAGKLAQYNYARGFYAGPRLPANPYLPAGDHTENERTDHE